MSWYEALAFGRWLTEVWQRAGLLPQGWAVDPRSAPVVESAAQQPWAVVRDTGLQRNPWPGRRYPWGDEPDPNRANYGDTEIGTSSAVGCFPGGVLMAWRS